MKIALIIITVLVVVIIVVCVRYGGFSRVVVKVGTGGGETIVYENMTGDYSRSPEVSDRIYNALLNEEKIETTKGVGIYYDNPRNVANDKLRSEIGCVIDGADSSTLARLAGKYSMKTLPHGEYVVAEFPFRGKLSVVFGIMKVYPALDKFCRERGYADGPITEIYDVPNKKITYRKEAWTE